MNKRNILRRKEKGFLKEIAIRVGVEATAIKLSGNTKIEKQMISSDLEKVVSLIYKRMRIIDEISSKQEEKEWVKQPQTKSH